MTPEGSKFASAKLVLGNYVSFTKTFSKNSNQVRFFLESSVVYYRIITDTDFNKALLKTLFISGTFFKI